MKTFCLVLIFMLLSCLKNTESIPRIASKAGPLEENVAYGKELILNTSHYFGPWGSIAQNSNGMNCTNCHLDAGTRDFGNNFKAVFSNYPKFRERSGTIESLAKRINDCFERSLNGKALSADSPELLAITDYINSVGKNIPRNTTPKESGIIKLDFLDKAADSAKGQFVYEQSCLRCHGKNGEGLLSMNAAASYFIYPPLWGEKSYTTAAGLSRIQNLSGFIYDNMPYNSAHHNAPLLSEEEAWNVAAFIISHPRPQKFFKEDWPDISKKPIDYAFGPLPDNFSAKQHQYGPFPPIIAFRKKKN